MELDAYARALGAAQTLVPSYNQLRLQGLQLQGQEQQNRNAALDGQFMQRRIAAADQEVAQQQAFVDDVRALGENPTPVQYRQVAARHPLFAKGLTEAAGALDAANRQRLVSDTARIYSALGANRTDVATSILRRQIDADKKAGGQADPEDEALLAMIQSGDAGQVAAAKGMLYGVLTSLDPDSAAKNIGEYGAPADEKRYVVGRALVDQKGNALYRDPDPVQYKEVDGSLYAVGGGNPEGGGPVSGPAGAPSGSGAPSGRRQFGWTPRARHGGDNSDAAVDGKLAGMAPALGIGIDQPFPSGMSNMQIAQALAISEGGRGSIADRNNNPGNLRDPRTGDYRKFPTKQAGLEAAAAQVARNRARGQNTIRSMVEGLPAGASQVAPGGSRLIVQGKPPEAKVAKPTETRVLNGRVFQKINGQWYAQGGA